MDAKTEKSNLIEGATGEWEVIIGMEVHAQVTLQRQAVLRRLDGVRRRAQLPCEPGRCGHARHAAGDQRGLRGASHPHRAGPQGPDQPHLGVRPEELFLSGPAPGLSDQPVQEPDRGRGGGHRRSPLRRARHRRHRAAASGAGRRQKPARPAPAILLCRSQPLGRGADGDRVEARPALLRAGQSLCVEAPHHPALSRHLRRQYGGGQSARRRERVGAASGRRARYALRDQERQLDPLHRPGHRVRGAPPDRDPGGRRRDSSGDAAVRRQDRRDAVHALQGRGARLPLLPRSRSSAARIDARLCGCACRGPA